MENFLRVIFEFVSFHFDDVKQFHQYQERANIANESIMNFLIILFIFSAGTYSLPVKGRKIYFNIMTMLFVFLPALVRTAYDNYAYDTQFAILCQLSDIFSLVFLSYFLGKKILGGENKSKNISIGLSSLTLTALALILMRVNVFISRPQLITHFLFCGLISYLIWKEKIFTHFVLHPKHLFLTCLLLFPFFNYFCAPAPPDADITTMSEMIGYLFQGKNFFHLVSGVQGEWYSLRYPAGLPALSWLYSQIFNIRASEILLLLWFFSFALLVFNLVDLGKRLKLNDYVIYLFSLNGVLMGWYGLRGGQVQEMLSYALGVGMITLIYDKKLLPSLLCLSAVIVMHPIVGFPFCLVFFFSWMKEFYQEKKIHWKGIKQISNWAKFLPLILSIVYLVVINLGKSNEPTQPTVLLQELNSEIFFQNILQFIQEDSLGYFHFYFLYALLFFFHWKKFATLFPIHIWFFAGLLLDGLLGQGLTRWGGRAHASFSTIGVWIISVSLSHYVLKILLFKCFIFLRRKTTRIKRIGLIANIKKKNIVTWSSSLGVIALTLFWLMAFKEDSYIHPSPIFSTHSNIRLARYMEKNLSKDALVFQKRFNMRPTWDSLNMLRGDSGHNTVLARIGSHQVGLGKLMDRGPFEECFKLRPSEIRNCFKVQGVSHLLIEVAEQKSVVDYLNSLELNLEMKIGSSYLYKL